VKPATETGIVFLHVPKTGGTSLRRLFELNVPEEARHMPATRAADYARELRGLAPERKAALRLVAGHMFFGVHELLPGGWRYVTVLRDPVDRCVSLYGYVRRQSEHPDHARAKSCRLEEFERGDNTATRFISGIGFTPGPCPRSALDTARANIEQHFLLVGVTERLDDFAATLCQRLGWPLQPLPRENIAPLVSRLGRVSAVAREVIESTNRLDTELYRYARSLWSNEAWLRRLARRSALWLHR